MPSESLEVSRYKLFVEYKADHPLIKTALWTFGHNDVSVRGPTEPPVFREASQLPMKLVTGLITDFAQRYGVALEHPGQVLLVQHAYLEGHIVLHTTAGELVVSRSYRPAVSVSILKSIFVCSPFDMPELHMQIGTEPLVLSSAWRVAQAFIDTEPS